jgi:beta-phosphoglucomutase-like phosphatase (HAD superfamily)
MGFELALASSGSRGSVETFLEINNCRPRFRSILTGADVTLAKPDPEIYLKTFAALQLPAEACVVIEDAVSGIEAARRAGAASIAITGTSSEEALRAAGAGHIVEHLLEIPELLNRP